MNEAQVGSTEAQLESARLERQRYDERYAVRVSSWSEYVTDGKADGPPVVKVQNRSPVSVSQIHFVVSDAVDHHAEPRIYYEAVATAPPCSILTFRLVPSGDEAVRDPFNSFALSLRFFDTVQWWEQTRSHGLHPSAGAPRPLALEELTFVPLDTGGRRYFANEVPDTRREASDCGEGG